MRAVSLDRLVMPIGYLLGTVAVIAYIWSWSSSIETRFAQLQARDTQLEERVTGLRDRMADNRNEANARLDREVVQFRADVTEIKSTLDRILAELRNKADKPMLPFEVRP